MVAAIEIEKDGDREELPRAGKRYWQGVLTGVFGAVFLLTAAGSLMINGRGLSIFIDQERLTAGVRLRIAEKAREKIPGIISKIAGEAAAGLLGGAPGPNLALMIGSRRMDLPAQTVDYLREQLQTAAADALQETLAKQDFSPYADELADEAYRLVQRTLAEEVYGKTFRFQANRWLSLPVTVEGAPDE